MNLRSRLLTIVLCAAGLAACQPAADEAAQLPTATLAPIVSLTPRFTATPIPSRTPLPTDTPTPTPVTPSPTPSDTPTPSATPPITGIVASLQTVNVREGPGVNFRAIKALVPGTGVQVLGQNDDGRWLNVRMEDGTEGWMSASLLRVNPAPTPIPTATPSPDLTAIALGTPLPTAVLGGGTITPTPPLSVITATPVTAAPVTPGGTPTGLALPVIDVTAIQQTATALAASGILVPSATGAPPNATPTFTPFGQVAPPATAATAAGVAGAGSGGPQQGVDVLAYCDNRSFGSPPPANLRAGATIDVFWSWFAATPEQVQQHVENAIYEVRVNGTLLENWRAHATRISRRSDGNYWIYWFVPFGPLAAGQYTITFRLTWQAQITDGYDVFGPGTGTPEETGTCTFTVQ